MNLKKLYVNPHLPLLNNTFDPVKLFYNNGASEVGGVIDML